MNHFFRVWPHFWPHRRKFFLSVAFALLVAFFWGLNLSMSFLVVKVFLQGENLQEYVEQEIAAAQVESEYRGGKVRRQDEELRALDERPTRRTADERVSLLSDRSRDEAKLNSATKKLLFYNWLKANVLPWVPTDNFDVFALILAVFLAGTIIKGVCTFVQEVLIGSVVELTTMGVRKQCFREVLKLDYQTLSLAGTPELMARFTYDMDVMAHGLRLLGGKVIREPLKAATCLALAFLVSWRLTLLSLLFAPLAVIVFYRIGKTLKRASLRLMEAMSQIYKTLEETFDGLKIVIAFNGASRHRRRFHHENKRYYRKAMSIVKLDALTSPTTETMGLMAALLALLPGAYLVLRGVTDIWGMRLVAEPMDIAELSLLYVALAGIIDPARKLSTTFSKLKRGAAAADRLFGFIDREPLVRQAADARRLPRHQRSIEFKNVGFRYATKPGAGSERPDVLDDVSLTVEFGEVIVVVGENGSGKSTLVNLLPRYYDPHRGAVLVDGADIRDVRLRDLRDQIGVVTQETLLFDDTIYENIRYGRTSASRAEVEEAARRAHVTQFLDILPDGFQTHVGDKGGRLSGGQRQRVALARAILRDPAILILDEATSAIDAQSERLIHQTLREFARGRTTFLITHSVSQSILDFVSRVVVMQDGRLIAAGRHQTLLETCPPYRSLFRAQVEQSTSQTAAA
ncbi:MAG: ABC transporter ATP-binding protein/permease [Planctomycetes bacterium]|nr:ABC transporter ATP-binding protein/permease [Planctomycetota bacterium]